MLEEMDGNLPECALSLRASHEILTAVICWDGWVACHCLTLATCLNKGKCSPLPINLQLGLLLCAVASVFPSLASAGGVLSVCMCVSIWGGLSWGLWGSQDVYSHDGCFALLSVPTFSTWTKWQHSEHRLFKPLAEKVTIVLEIIAQT